MTQPGAPENGASGRGVARWALLTLLVAAALMFAALGVWQIQRLHWKHALIAHVDARVHAPPVAAPGPERWPHITAANDEYTRITLSGTYRHDKEALVAASTERGPGYWVMTPLARDDGTAVIVNRGFVTAEFRDPATRTATRSDGVTTVVGLLRISEADQWILRQNDAAADRWYRRDPEQIAQARGFEMAAPYFVDAEAAALNTDAWPIGGMTRLRFSDNHLVYALTWFSLSALSAVAIVLVVRSGSRADA